MGSQHGRKPPNPTKLPKSHGHRPSPPPPHPTSGKGACCSYQEAGKALMRAKFRLAARYVRMDVKARLGVI